LGGVIIRVFGNKKMKKTAQWGIIVIISFFFLFVKIRPAFAACTTGSCGSQCGCKGECWYDSVKWLCSIPGCNEWDYESDECECKPEYTGSYCYYNEDCLKTKCIDYGICQDWSGGSPCNNCWSWSYCQTIGNDAQRKEWCCDNNPPPNNTPTPPPPSCDVSFTQNVILPLGYSYIIEANVLNIWGGIPTSVNFSSGNSAIATVNPSSDPLSPYYIQIIGEGEGETTITANVIISGSSRCSAITNVSVLPPGPWWQVQDGDIYSSGNIISIISPVCSLPYCIPFLNLDGFGGYPGIPISPNSLILGTSGEISSTNWNSIANLSLKKSYSFFEKQIPSNTEITNITANTVEGDYFSSEGILSNGAYWYKYTNPENQDFTINSDIDIGSRKVILLINGSDLYIKGKINLTDGEGFFMVVVGKSNSENKGNIYIDPEVSGDVDYYPEIEGLLFADGQIYTGNGNGQLHIRGSIVGMDGIILERDLIDNSNVPSEFIEYSPDQVVLMPNCLRTKNTAWKEIQP